MSNTKKQFASNPLLDNKTFVPDVEAHLWNDGRIYLYGSMDIMGNMNYCSTVHHVYSSDDLVNWIDHGVAFSTDASSWAKDCKALYAPDCAYRDGWYYLYYNVPDGRCGVAKSQTPAGPFEDVGQIKGVKGIDPSVFIDDDGQAYLYWGQLTWCHVAKLKDNMTEIDEESITTPLTVEEHEFHEGSSVKKINGRYYYLFADTHRHGNSPTCLGYAVSDHPMRGFKYGGVVVDNFGCDCGVWNNHGSIERFGEQWYVFYHRSTHGSKFSRRVCAEPIFFNDDGSISEVKQTTSGVSGTLPASSVLEAHRACELSGNIRASADSETAEGLALTEIKSGDTATYRYLSFAGETNLSVSAKCEDKCRIELYIDGSYHAEISLSPSEKYRDTTHPIPEIKGNRTVTLKFFSSSDLSLSHLSFS